MPFAPACTAHAFPKTSSRICLVLSCRSASSMRSGLPSARRTASHGIGHGSAAFASYVALPLSQLMSQFDGLPVIRPVMLSDERQQTILLQFREFSRPRIRVHDNFLAVTMEEASL